jgi:ATP-dependent exoDNAse (exonuclease V) alpha subunit
MQLANDDEEVFNGDLGLVRAVDAEAGELLVDFDGREVAYDFGELDAVVLPVTTQHWPMLQRTLLYTVSGVWAAYGFQLDAGLAAHGRSSSRRLAG